MRKDVFYEKHATKSMGDVPSVSTKNCVVVQQMAATVSRNTENSHSTSWLFSRGIPVDLESDTFFAPNKKNMITLDNLLSTSAKDAWINDLFREGSHHKNLSVVVFNQDLYFGKYPS